MILCIRDHEPEAAGTVLSLISSNQTVIIETEFPTNFSAFLVKRTSIKRHNKFYFDHLYLFLTGYVQKADTHIGPLINYSAISCNKQASKIFLNITRYRRVNIEILYSEMYCAR